jgi:hypothetical protein
LIVLGVLPILDFSGAILILSLMAYGVYKAKSS